MVCSRCKMVVKSELEKLGLYPISVELGEVEIAAAIDNEKKKSVKIILFLPHLSYDFVLIQLIPFNPT